jgi:cold shock protein
MAKGVCKWFDDGKGFGFIEQADGGPDCFVHYSDIEGTGRKTLVEGQKVEFEAQASSRGPKAIKVKKI